MTLAIESKNNITQTFELINTPSILKDNPSLNAIKSKEIQAKR